MHCGFLLKLWVEGSGFMLNQQEFWQLFAQTGEPMAYVLYKETEQDTQNRQEGTSCSSTSTPGAS
ncbi:MAG: YqzL family protein [Intestinibacillus sp.]